MITIIYIWRIKQIFIPFALLHMALDRLLLRRRKSIKFFKSLGTGNGETFTPSDADSTRWGLIIVISKSDFESFNKSFLIKSWQSISKSYYQAELAPLSSHGLWSKKSPFSYPSEFKTSEWSGKVAAITRARIKFSLNKKFWGAVPPVTVSLKSSPGLLSAIGIGEAPIGLQGTFSRWASGKELSQFAYKGAAHVKAIAQTKELDWYSEELFARFAIVEESGQI